MNTPTTMTLILSSCPNPDWGQTDIPAPQQRVHVDSFAEASAVARAYIAQHDLGGGNWDGGQILDADGQKIARVSYNGKVWWSDPCAYHPGQENETPGLESDKLEALKRDYEKYLQLYALADTLGRAPGRATMVDTVFHAAGELLDEIIVELAGETMYLPTRWHLDKLNEGGHPLPEFDALCRWMAHQAGLRQPNAHDLEGYYVIRLDQDEVSPFEHCLHLTFDDPETLVVDIFDRVGVVMPYGVADLIAPPIFINLRTGQAWHEGCDPPQTFPLPQREYTPDGSGDVDGR